MPKIDVTLRIPKTKSHVPELCSIYANSNGDHGKYGDAKFRGNCSGYIIRDVLEYYCAMSCFDAMEGSGTCRDVCEELGIEFGGMDLSNGTDARDSTNFTAMRGEYDFVWMHPPYWDMIVYNDHPDCLSQAKTLVEFLQALSEVVDNCLSILKADGRMGILIGGYTRYGFHFPLAFETWRMIVEEHDLRLAACEIIRPSYGATSSYREYSTSFIPCVHDTLMVFQRK